MVSAVRISSVRCGLQTKKQTQDHGGSLQELAADRGRLNSRPVPAPRKKHGRQRTDKDDDVSGTPKVQTFQETRLPRTKRNTGISHRPSDKS
jgi:hypothetical protein